MLITIEKLETENRLTLKQTLYKLSPSRSCYLPKRITMIKKIQFSEPDILGFEVDGRVSEAAFVNKYDARVNSKNGISGQHKTLNRNPAL